MDRSPNTKLAPKGLYAEDLDHGELIAPSRPVSLLSRCAMRHCFTQACEFSLEDFRMKSFTPRRCYQKDVFVNEPVVENYKAMSSEEEPKVVRKYDDAPSIKEWVSDDEEEDVSQPKTEKKIVRPNIVKKEFYRSVRKSKRKSVKNMEHARTHEESEKYKYRSIEMSNFSNNS
ncbi:hypothetical protein Tco_0831357 [Tanacetum coccineum]